MQEDAYRHITYDFTLAAAKTLWKLNPQLRFCYVSGASTDSSEKGSMMWARVKGKTENDLLLLNPNAHMFRPGYIHPVKGARSATPWLRVLYGTLGPVLYPVLRVVASKWVTTTELVGRAMIAAGHGKTTLQILEVQDINALALLAPT